MKAVLIDDEKLCLEIETAVLKDVEMIDEVKAFSKVDELLDYVSNNKIDLAFLDIIMGEADGILVAAEIKQIQPACKIIFVSGSRDYALEAFQVYASGYLLKPISHMEVENLLMNI